MRKSTIFCWLAFGACVALAWNFLDEVISPMTEERYRRLCDNQPECYPEAGFMLLAVAFGYVGICFGVNLLYRGAVDLIWRWRAARH